MTADAGKVRRGYYVTCPVKLVRGTDGPICNYFQRGFCSYYFEE
jgi:hypothetical protein